MDNLVEAQNTIVTFKMSATGLSCYRNESFLSRVKNKVPKVSPTTKGRGKTGLAIITNLVLPAIDEITDFVSGFRFLW